MPSRTRRRKQVNEGIMADMAGPRRTGITAKPVRRWPIEKHSRYIDDLATTTKRRKDREQRKKEEEARRDERAISF